MIISLNNSRSTLRSSINLMSRLMKMIHSKCRGTFYPRTNNAVKRFPVSDEQVPWEVHFDEYNPTNYTAAHILTQPWADLETNNLAFKPKWNEEDGSVNRKSFIGTYKIIGGMPQNPMGRTGVVGRGVLGRWGPNHAADPIVTRWKRNNNDIERNSVSDKPILQFIGIKRKDCGEWALPGGMVDAGEVVTTTLKREFMEEALNSLELSSKDHDQIEEKINSFFSNGTEVFKGYVDDPRNTDNSWMETVAMNFHDDTGESVGFPLTAGDDASKVKWIDISKELKLYASHIDFIAKVANDLKAHW